MQNHYYYNNIDINYESAQTSIHVSKPIFADLFIGKKDDTYIFHAILTAGVGRGVNVTCYAPLTDTYDSTSDLSGLMNPIAIELGNVLPQVNYL